MLYIKEAHGLLWLLYWNGGPKDLRSSFEFVGIYKVGSLEEA